MFQYLFHSNYSSLICLTSVGRNHIVKRNVFVNLLYCIFFCLCPFVSCTKFLHSFYLSFPHLCQLSGTENEHDVFGVLR